MAKAKGRPPGSKTGKAPGSGDAPRKVIAQLKASAKFGKWFGKLRMHTRLPSPLLLELALIEYAKNHGFEDPPPER